jgi:membrane protein implicated in regulation of membrane protease activity
MGVFADLLLYLDGLTAWHWLALGAVLLAVEIASTTSYLLWPGIAALVVGALQFLVPGLGGALSVFLFAVLAIAASVVWQRSPLGKPVPTQQPNLNARMNTYLGRQGAAAADFVGGQGAILLDDTRWPAAVIDGSAPRGGDMLQVTGADGTILRVRAAGP